MSWIDTPSNDREIKTMDDIEKKMVPELQSWSQYVQPYLLKRFTTIYESLKSGQQQLDDDTLEELNMIRESYQTHMTTVHQAIRWAICQTIQRNLSHNVWENLIFPKDKFQDFISFCDMGEIDCKSLWKDKFETLLKMDAEKLKDSELNKIYVQLRQGGKSPIEAIKALPWKYIIMKNMQNWWVILPSNEDILEWSKMWSTDYCLGRVNTILWIIALNEWTEYLNKYFKYADVLRDWAEDVLQLTPENQRDISYLSEYLSMEDPHQIVVYVDDDWKKYDIDTNQIWLEQLWCWIPKLNITKVYKWDVSKIAYEIYFLNYLNTYFNSIQDPEEKNRIAMYVDICNKQYWTTYTITKRLINYAIQMRDPKIEKEIFWEIKKLAEDYPCIKDTLAYQMELNEWDTEKIDEFIHKKYWPQFDSEDIKYLLWLNNLQLY